MLVAGPNSACDVCLENFGCDGKTPCSISCGHVFCVDCLTRVERPQCPLCRNYFDPRATIRLHLDLDNVKSSPKSTTTVVALTSDDEDANRLREAIASIATTGCTETTVRKLLADGKTFLARVPKSSYKDLRTHHRLITYLCEVKTNLRSQKSVVEQYKTENELLQKEKAELEKEKEKLLKEIETRKEQQANALKVEVDLRDHCQKAHEAYTSMINQYNYVAAQWSKLNEEVKRLRMVPSTDDVVVRSSPSSLELDHRQLTGAAVRKQDSILCTPLPEFTSKSLFLQPLPGTEEEEEEDDDEGDDEDDDEDDEDDESSEESDPEPSEKRIADHPMKYVPTKSDPSDVLCTSSLHPYSCKCADSDDTNARKLGVIPRPAYVDHLKPALIQGGLSRTAPRSDVRRARSYSNPSTSSSRGASTSRSASRSPSPRVRSPAPNSFAAAYTSSPSQSSNAPRTTDGEALRSRLHNILSDTSSSPPKPATVASASAAARERENRAGRHRSPSPSRSPSPPQHSSHLRRHSSQVHRSHHSQSQQPQQENTTDQFSRLLASHQPPTPPLSTSPNARTSSASEAARALEQSKRDRQKAERDERERNSRRSAERAQPREATTEQETTHRVRSATSSQALGPSFHQKIVGAVNTLEQRHGSANAGASAPLQSRPSTTNFNAPQTQTSSSHSHREYVQPNQPMSRYNTISGKHLSSSAIASLQQQQGTFAS